MVLQYDKAPGVTATIVILTVLAYGFFGLRIYTRTHYGSWGIDDWTMTVAAIPFTALSVSCLGGSFNGIGVHVSRLSDVQQMEGLHWFFFFEIFYCAAIIPIKLSISFMLMRVAAGRKNYIRSLWVASAIFTTMNLIAFFYIIFHCSPVQYAWNTSIPGGKCNPATVLADIYYATTAVNIATDWFTAILPIPLLWNVQLNRNAKVSVAVILGLGALASLSACVRLSYTINLTNSNDYLYGIGDIVIWGYAENGIGMIVGCISTLRPLFRRILRLGDSHANSSIKITSNAGKYGTSRSHKLSQNQSQIGYQLEERVQEENFDYTTIKGGHGEERSWKDNDSQEEILGDAVHPGGNIVLTKSVNVQYSNKP